MHHRPGIVFSTASAVVLSYVVVLARQCAVHLARLAALEAHTTTEEQMLAPTVFAVRHAWAFIVSIGFIAAFTAWRVVREPTNAARFLVFGASCEGLVAWGAMVCFCYEPFLCDVAHPWRDPRFDMGMFLSAVGGMFPVSLVALLASFASSMLKAREGGVDR